MKPTDRFTALSRRLMTWDESSLRLGPVFLLIFFSAGAFLVLRNMPVGPIPAGDEVQYSLMSRKYAYSAAWIPNYIFYLFYSSVNFCADQFYACAKLINVVFLIVTATFVFLTCRLVAGPILSLLVMTAFLLSPFNVYTSMFMPETMYACGAWILLYYFVYRAGTWQYHDSIVTGAGVALLSMIKTHGLFFGAIYLSAILCVSALSTRRSARMFASNGAAFVASLLLVRFLVGYLLAGSPGLSLFGVSYTLKVTRHGFLDYLYIAQLAITPLANHILAIALIAGPPLCVIFLRGFSIQKIFDRNPRAASLSIFTAIFVLFMIAVVSIFTATVINSSSETLDRLHTRYYNFLIFSIYIAAIAELDQNVQQNGIKIAIATIMSLASLFSILYLPSHFQQSMVDNPEIHGLFLSQNWFLAYAVLNLILIVYWAYDSRRAITLFLALQLPLGLMLSAKLLTRDLRGMVEFHNLYPKAGVLARTILGKPVPNFFVAGQGVSEGWHTMFHMDKMGTLIKLAPDATLLRAAIPRGIMHGIIIGSNPIDFEHTVVHTNGLIRIIQITTP